MTPVFVNSMNGGDCFWSANYLSRLPGHHTLHCRPQHHKDLKELFPDNITFKGMEDIPVDAIDCWIGTQAEYSWHGHLTPKDLILFLTTVFFEGISRRIGVENPFKCREDFLYRGYSETTKFNEPSHTLIIDCEPRSGQCNGVKLEELDDLQFNFGQRVRERGYSLWEIGQISTEVGCIAGVATGPIWPCLNIHNKGKPFYVLLDQVYLDYGPTVRIEHFSNVKDMADALRRYSWIV